MGATTDNPCLDCGACCATYRVSFYWAEADALGLPAQWTQRLSPFLACMAGTSNHPPRCSALLGEVGIAAACRIYQQRPLPCREVAVGSDQCRRARARHHLPELPESIADEC
jgi:Fe-S-cluster containining protein